jgi:hypothetical protein
MTGSSNDKRFNQSTGPVKEVPIIIPVPQQVVHQKNVSQPILAAIIKKSYNSSTFDKISKLTEGVRQQ